MINLETSLSYLAQRGHENEDENYRFKEFLQAQDGAVLDRLVAQLNHEVEPQVDCTACGNCCKSLMINVTQPEAEGLSAYLQMDVAAFNEKYIETSQQGEVMVINTIPCHFLNGTTCCIYEHRFAECRDFPGLQRGNFKERLFATFMHYGRCPITYNVIEQLKTETGFRVNEPMQ